VLKRILRFGAAMIPFIVTPAQGQTNPTTGPASITVIGSIEPFWSADQFAKTAGYASEIKADIGDHVKKGQVLAVIDAPELVNELNAKRAMAKAAQAVIVQAQTSLEVARKRFDAARAQQKLSDATLKRQEQLFADKAATEQQMDEVRARADVTTANAAEAEAKIASAEADVQAAQANANVAAAEVGRLEALVGYLQIIAPFDGVVTRRWVSPGDLVQAATASKSTPLFTCQQIDTLRVFCDVPESAAPQIRIGDDAAIQLYSQPASAVHAKVSRLASAMNSATRTMRVEIDVPNSKEQLLPGSYAQVTLTPTGKH